MTEGQTRPGRTRVVDAQVTRITDPQVMRALAHPARIGILEHLSANDTGATATECAALVGLSPSATSYHLRELARYGLVEHAPGRGDARERVWRSVSRGWRVEGDPETPDAVVAEHALVDTYLTRDFGRIRQWFAVEHDAPQQWRDASELLGSVLLLTADELRAVNAAVHEAIAPYRRRQRLTNPPDGARTVAVHYATFPID